MNSNQTPFGIWSLYLGGGSGKSTSAIRLVQQLMTQAEEAESKFYVLVKEYGASGYKTS